MTHYLLSVHGAAGETRPPMTEEEMQRGWQQILALEELRRARRVRPWTARTGWE